MLPAVPLFTAVLFTALLFAAVLCAADPWQTKQISQWTDEDAQRVLTGSPWVKRAVPIPMAQQTDAQKRGTGREEGARATGLDQIRLPTTTAGPGGSASSSAPRSGPPRLITLTLRWESALPVRAAELKAREVGAPAIDEGNYAVAVYGIPNSSISGNLSFLREFLKRAAVLKREGKKDIKASRVDLFQEADGAVLLYLFPKSNEITNEDARVEFQAQIGRYTLNQAFDTAGMQFQGKLEL